MSTVTPAAQTGLASEVTAALATVVDPELDEPITDLGFVRSIRIDDVGVTVHLRLPTSFCAPNFAYLMAADAQDALRRVPGAGRVMVLLDDHHDSDRINAGLALNAGYRGTFGPEAEDSLDELRRIFQRKAHTAAMERCVMALLRTTDRNLEDLHELTLGELPGGPHKEALLRRRTDIGLGIRPDDLVVVDEDGRPVAQSAVPLRLRYAKAVRVSVEGNAHFCRGLLATRYDDEPGGLSTHITDTRRAS
ncbi:iron-sulfur cluster assembly protein [Kribbella monticola]|uniref:iron-sulfur cluster assembly protein n=1 Tax=Kribbella monticola TaxID=2185285 RepID=UPI000DD4CAFF|nr:iron-sulfur cluster assembly protein [Kribbella monticola]